VNAIHLRLGALSGVVKEALQGSFEIARSDTPLENAQLIIEELPILIACRTCDANRAVSSLQLFCCAECGTPSADVVQGKEIEVAAMEIEEWDHSPA
jgi:hydrogenase nickel incorporation protein HypA/HybF